MSREKKFLEKALIHIVLQILAIFHSNDELLIQKWEVSEIDQNERKKIFLYLFRFISGEYIRFFRAYLGGIDRD